MMDPNLQDFYRRVSRVEAARAAGFGFEATGTIGRSHYRKPRKRRLAIVKPLLVLVLSVLVLKATIHHHIGDATYQARVQALKASDGFERIGGHIMAADPATLWLSAQITRLAMR